MPEVTGLSALGIFIVYLLKTVIPSLKDLMNGEKARQGDAIDSMRSQVEHLYDWHAKEDSSGVKIWYTKPGLEEALKDNTQVIREIKEALARLTATIERLELRVDTAKPPRG